MYHNRTQSEPSRVFKYAATVRVVPDRPRTTTGGLKGVQDSWREGHSGGRLMEAI